MEILHEHLLRWVKTSPVQVDEIIYSPHTVRGEGEHKIMSYLRQHRDGVNVVHGLDTDLIFLTLVSPATKLFLWRAFDDNKRIIIDIELLRREISGYVKNPLNFMVMGLLLGNDFLPGQPSLVDFSVSIDTMIKAFQESRVENLAETVDNVVEIRWPDFFEFLRVLSAYEIPLLRLESYKQYRYPSDAIDYATHDKEDNTVPFDIEKYRRFWYMRALGDSDPWIFPHELRRRVTQTSLRSQVNTYLNMIQWVVHYYTQDAIDERRLYPYFFSPLIMDLRDGLVESWPNVSRRGLTINETLLAILPLRHSSLAPSIRDFFSETGPIGWIYPASVTVIGDGVDEDWRHINLVPFVTYDDIHDAFMTTGKHPRSRLPSEPVGADVHQVKKRSSIASSPRMFSYQELPQAI